MIKTYQNIYQANHGMLILETYDESDRKVTYQIHQTNEDNTPIRLPANKHYQWFIDEVKGKGVRIYYVPSGYKTEIINVESSDVKSDILRKDLDGSPRDLEPIELGSQSGGNQSQDHEKKNLAEKSQEYNIVPPEFDEWSEIVGPPEADVYIQCNESLLIKCHEVGVRRVAAMPSPSLWEGVPS